MNTVFTDLPRPIERDAYTRCQEAACEIVHSHPDCIGLYGAGEVRYPGLSDLDLVIVLAEGSSIRPILQGQNLPEPGPYLANHSFPHYPPEIFRWLHYLFPLFSPLQPLVEKEPIDLEPSPQDPEDAKQLAAFYVADYLVKKIYHLLDYTDGRPVPVRQLLCHLHTIRYTLSCLEQATGTAIGTQFSEDIDGLRRDWFDLELEVGQKRLMDLIPRGAALGFEIAWVLAPFLASWLKMPNERSDSELIEFTNREMILLFGTGDLSAQETLDIVREWPLDQTVPVLGKRLRLRPLLQPLSLSVVPATYAHSSGPWSDWLRSSLSHPPQSIGIVDSPALSHRAKLLNEVARISKTGQLKNSYSYGFPPKGESLGRRLASKVVKRHARRCRRSLLRRTLR